MRAFIALDIDPDVKQTVLDHIRHFRNSDIPVRWVRPEGIHLTLKFLGEISDDRTRRIQTEMGAVASRHRSFSLRIQGLGSFPPGSRSPRVVWAGIEAPGSLLALQEDLDKALSRVGFPREGRRFHPHLTLGRVKIPRGLDPLLDFLAENEAHLFGGQEVNGIVLFKSMLKPSGAEYTKIHIAELS